MVNQSTNRPWLAARWGALGAVVVALGLGAWSPRAASGQSATLVQRTAARLHAASPAATRAVKASTSEVSTSGRRDPFQLPPPPGKGEEAGITGPLPPGKRGLVIGQLRLEGIVREDKSNTMIAVVTNETNRAYFLRDNDEVYNGVVSKITPDSVYFRENALQSNGQLVSREVVKKLSLAPGEGR